MNYTKQLEPSGHASASSATELLELRGSMWNECVSGWMNASAKIALEPGRRAVLKVLLKETGGLKKDCQLKKILSQLRRSS